ncbi:chemotaxis response regulator protein-glutamate methylesterase [Hymenobacter qilianensis]|uniref:Chemotaxis response regulator protein-glutamate methylesterase n=1 Tax=Hymenobacter qilianensis TaxID=1385715 RepID=A0ACB5PR91_9BACT|nr:chemotaxis response regulator protein-glutamate methylesterase [Hymenobacter qilianensis]
MVQLELTRLLQYELGFHVVDSADSADELVILARRFRPALVILDEYSLPDLDRLQQQHSCPVLLYAAAIPLAGVLCVTARWGIYDYIAPLQLGAEQAFRRAVLQQLQAMPIMPRVATFISPLRHIVSAQPQSLTVIGASTGGTAAVEQLVQALCPGLPSTLLIAVHLPAYFTASFAKRLQRLTPLPVKIGVAGMPIEEGQIIIAPGGQNMVLKPVQRGPWRVWQIGFSTKPNLSADAPSIDMLMRSAAKAASSRALGIILTGLGQDGTGGAKAIRARGGQVIAQSQESAALFSMPGSVIRAGHANAVLPLDQIAEIINQRAALPAPAACISLTLATVN